MTARAPARRARRKARSRRPSRGETARGPRLAKAPPALFERLIAWLELLPVTEGSRVGERLALLPFQRRFIKGILRSRRAALSIARGNGKTALAAALGAAALCGPLAVLRGQVVIVASSLAQARIAFDHAKWFLRPLLDDPEQKGRWRIHDSKQYCEIEDRRTGAKLRCIGSDPKRAHGLAPILVICDEPAQWPTNLSGRMRAALVTALGKQPDSRLVAIGTKPDDPFHWFARMLEGGHMIYGQIHSAASRLDDFSMKAIRQANPAWDHLPDLQETILEEREEARIGGEELAAFRAYRLNRGTPDTNEHEVLVTRETWAAIEVEQMPPRVGPCFVGFDAGGSRSMTAATAYWPKSGRFECRAAFPSEPPLEARGREDMVGDRYVHMRDRGELWTLPGRVTPVGRFLEECRERWLVGAEVELFMADEYRKSEVQQAMGQGDVQWPVEWRRVGRGQHGAEDIRGFQNEVLDGPIRTLPSLLMSSSLANSVVRRDTNGNPYLDKSRQRARIDPIQAGVMAVAAGRRWRIPPLEGVDRSPEDYVLHEMQEAME